MPQRVRHIAIAGAGPGGLTLALCLHRAGFRVTVLEQTAVLAEIGAGVQLSPNGVRVLHRLGLAAALDAVAFRPERGEMRHWRTGEVMSTRPLGQAAEQRYGFPYYHLHRADLQAVLVAAVQQRVPRALQLDSRVIGFDTKGSGVRVSIESTTPLDADALVGADGIHSRVRQLLFGADRPRYTGCVAWRAMVPASALPAGHVRPVASNWLGRGGHFVHYYVRRGQLVNCVGVRECGEWSDETWYQSADIGAFKRDFDGWHSDLLALIEQGGECFRWGLFDREPMGRWSQGPVTLLGDACHPMLPFMAQGAVMAIEDAYVLAACLLANGGAESAFAQYESLRRERTAGVQALSRANMSIFHEPDACNFKHRLLQHRDAHLALYGHDVTNEQFTRGNE